MHHTGDHLTVDVIVAGARGYAICQLLLGFVYCGVIVQGDVIPK